MTYEDALRFWYGRINYEVRSARPGDLKLERMRALLRLLGDPQDRLRIVHVTGTKGKGSTCAMLDAILQASGYRVGLFTSPHLERVEERMQVNRSLISPSELAALMADVAAAVHQLEEQGGLPGLTFFEIGTALGFLYFCRRRCDIAVVEVGLGGRFDSTNVCRPLVAVITSVGIDHTYQLGNTLEAIAYQKAGIVKQRTPLVSGVTQPGPKEVIRCVARSVTAPVAEIETDFRYAYDLSPAGSRVTIETQRRLYRDLPLNLLGDHQGHNAAVAVAIVERLREAGMPVPDSAIARGFEQVRWPARVEILSRRPVVVLDTAHNVPSAEALVDTLSRLHPPGGRARVIVGVSSDKQYVEILRILARYFNHFHLTRYSNNPRSVPPEKLVAVMEEAAPGVAYDLHPTAPEAWAAAHASLGPNDLLCVTGSVFLAGELRGVMSRPG